MQGLFFQIGNWINTFAVVYTSDAFVFANSFKFTEVFSFFTAKEGKS